MPRFLHSFFRAHCVLTRQSLLRLLVFKRPAFTLLALALLITNCTKKEDFSLPGPDSIKETGINSWILNNMEYYYYWNNRIPEGVDTSPAPPAFFSSLLVPEDRFSVMVEKIETPRSQSLLYEVGVTADDPGFEYQYVYLSSISRILGQVLYVKEGTPAWNAGLKRGDLYWKVDETPLNYLNYYSLIESKGNSFRLTLLNKERLALGVQADEKTLQITKTDYLADNPIALDTIYRLPEGNAGYLVYHFFAPGHSGGSATFDNELNQIFKRFREQEVSAVILDLRYNRGGYESSAKVLSSLLVPNLSDELIFSKKKYNQTYSADLKRYYATDTEGYFVDYFVTRANGVMLENLNKADAVLYVLTTSSTASAGELVINSLKVYMDVVIIGETTVGKNMGSITLTQDENRDNPWEMHPLVVKVFNAQGESDYAGGFAPQTAISEELLLYPYGDIRDPLLAEALDRISPLADLESETSLPRSVKSQPLQRLSSSVNNREALLYIEKAPTSDRDTYFR